ncbi:tandem-type lipoprotein [Enterococcus sp. DIV0849a]|uniref:tandem-type lipoprotein n=1 Tax=unclassified Enterococcus TaxID=2608891 RepID=UPI001A8D7274|nr:tandem-type lipoprotein [Enterococcus sp. DIV0849a]MBO0435231.1 tandem-type lipoprotein [Enterococcus sp. DIV0849a]
MKKLYLFIGGLILMSGLTGCETKNKAEIEQSFDKVLALYPTPNLESFYDMEGYKDDEFDKDDKGVWVLNSDFSMSKTEEGDLFTEGMRLRINRNTRKMNGYYYVSITPNSFGKSSKTTKYPVVYTDNGFQSKAEISDKELQRKIEKFQFFVQYGKFDKLDSYKNLKKMYNPEVPMYELEYQLTNDDSNVNELRKRNDIPTKIPPTLLLKGTGNLDGSSVGYKQVEIRFDKKLSVYFSDFIDFQPLSEEDLTVE